MGFLGGSDGKESACNAGDPGWPREFHGQRGLAGYSPWGCKETDTTEQLTLSLFSLSVSVKLLSSAVVAEKQP